MLRKTIWSMIFMIFEASAGSSSNMRRTVARNFSYKFRPATPLDIPFIQNVNRANLPENYDGSFYKFQISKWPELSLICEDSESTIVAYSLGQILDSNDISIQTTANRYATCSQIPNRGHITSIAVSPKHRGRGIANQLMSLLHNQFALYYSIDEINLYCRTSNAPAIKLYQSFNYECLSISHKYYSDGEDASCMALLNFQNISKGIHQQQRQSAPTWPWWYTDAEFSRPTPIALASTTAANSYLELHPSYSITTQH